MIIKLDKQIQINFVETKGQKFLLITPKELGFTEAVDFDVLFKRIKEMKSIPSLDMKWPTIFDPDKVVSISLPSETYKFN